MHEDPVNILLVDDQPGKLLAYEAILGELGERLVKANSAREALDVLLRTEIAVILIDVHMPELDGFELAAMIRRSRLSFFWVAHPVFSREKLLIWIESRESLPRRANSALLAFHTSSIGTPRPLGDLPSRRR